MPPPRNELPLLDDDGLLPCPADPLLAGKGGTYIGGGVYTYGTGLIDHGSADHMMQSH